jgi:C4-dicarboxylate-binding protein DctP
LSSRFFESQSTHFQSQVGEVYIGLQRGTMDGVLTSLGTAFVRKFYELVKYCLLFKGGEFNVPPPVLINLKKLKEIPPELQNLLFQTSKEAQVWAFGQCQRGMEEFLVGMKEKGMEIFTLSGEEKKRWSETNRNILVNYLERTGKVGKELVDEIGQVQ